MSKHQPLLKTFSIRFLADTNLPIKFAHKSRKVGRMITPKQRIFIDYDEAVNFYNECFFPLTTTEEIVAMKRVKHNVKEVEISKWLINNFSNKDFKQKQF